MTTAQLAVPRPQVQLLALRAREWWTFIKSQSVPFWAILLYLMVEYVRPQQIIKGLDTIPLGNLTLGLAFFSFLFKGGMFSIKGLPGRLLLVFALVVILSSLFGFNPHDSIMKLVEVMNWVIIFFLIVNIVTTDNRFIVFTMAFLLFNMYMAQGAVRQFAGRGFSFADWGVVGAPGWFANSGDFGAAMCLFLPISWRYYMACKDHASRLKRLLLLSMPGAALIGVLACSSRGAQLGVAAVVLWELGKSRYKVRALVLVTIVGIIGAVTLPEEQWQRFNTAGSDTTSTLRLTYWKRGIVMTKEHPVLGIGYAQWMPYYRNKYRGEVAQVSHNIFVQCMSELGLVGLLVFLSMIFGTFYTNAKTRKMTKGLRARDPPRNPLLFHLSHGLDAALVGFLVSGFFVTILYYPFFWINLTMTAVCYALARTFRRTEMRAAMLAPVPAATGGRSSAQRRR